MEIPPSRNSRVWSLYVSNIPEELNKNGITDIFEHYGNVVSLFHRPGTNWAYVTYNNYTEAENAMRDLNNAPPLELKLSLAKERKFNETSNKESLSVKNETVQESKRDQWQNDHVERSKCFQQNQGIKDKGQVYSALNNSCYSYDETIADQSTSALWTRGQVTVTSDNKRHVSLGRGYTLYEIPNPHPQVEKHIELICEKRYPGLYQYGKDVLTKEVGKCIKCLNIAKHKCQRCHDFYCSQQCQVADWPRHKNECIPVPGLISATEQTSISESKNHKELPIGGTSTPLLPLRQPKTVVKPVENTINKDSSLCQPENNKTRHKAPEINSIALRHPNIQSPANVKEGHGPHQSNEHKLNVQDANEIDKTIAFHKPTFLSKEEFTVVRIALIVNDREYWVQKIHDDFELTELALNLQNEVPKYPKAVPTIGNMYAAFFEGLWYRCIVTSVNPLKVHLVDFGNDITLRDDEIRECGSFKGPAYFAHRIRFPHNVNEKYRNCKEGDIVPVKMLSMDKDMVIDVQVKDESNPSLASADNIPNNITPQVKEPSQEMISSLIMRAYAKLPKVIDLIKNKSSGVVHVYEAIGRQTYVASLQPFDIVHQLKVKLQSECTEQMNGPSKSPIIGELMCGQKEDGTWIRGYSLSVSLPCKMIAIDEARQVTVNRIIPCPPQCNSIPAVGVTCEQTETTDLTGYQGIYESNSCMPGKSNHNQSEVEIEISVVTKKIKALVRTWDPLSNRNLTSNTNEINNQNLVVNQNQCKNQNSVSNQNSTSTQKSSKFTKVKNNTEVYIVAYRSPYLVYASSLDTNEIERSAEIMHAVALCAQTAPYLKEPPTVGQLVIAPYKDGNFYRAIVRNIKNDKVDIIYVDFGNSVTISISKLQILSKELQEKPFCAAKLILKDVPENAPMTEAVDDYLAALVGKEVPLMCTFEDDQANGVVLKEPSGQCVNDKIKNLLIPIWKKPNDFDNKTCFMIQDLRVIPLGKVGDTVTANVLQSNGNSECILCINLSEVISYIQNKLPTMIKEYSESTDYYIPRDEELCLAAYGGTWYRAACIYRTKTETTSSMFFVDYGILEDVEHKNIRAMTKDFMVPNALACPCTIHNLAPKDDKDEYNPLVRKRLSELIQNGKTLKIKILEAADDGSYDIELPDIRRILMVEGFISS